MKLRALSEAWRNYWFTPSRAENLAILRIVCYSALLLSYLGLDDRAWMQVSSVFWMPISFFRLLPQPHSLLAISVAQAIWKASLLTSAIGLFSRASRILAFSLGAFLLGLPNSFGKIHHLDGFPVLLLAILCVARCSDALTLDKVLGITRSQNLAPSGDYTWPARLAQVLFLLVFVAAGLAKVRNSGFAWVSADNMRYLVLSHYFTHEPPTQLGQWIARSDVLCWLGAAGTIVLELGALPAIFLRRIRVIVLAGLFSLQVMIGLALGIYFVPHLAGYVLFLPWSRVLARIERRGGHRRHGTQVTQHSA